MPTKNQNKNAEKPGLQPVDIVEVEADQIMCDGGTGALGHPAIYMRMGDEGYVDCPYCGTRFLYVGNKH